MAQNAIIIFIHPNLIMLCCCRISLQFIRLSLLLLLLIQIATASSNPTLDGLLSLRASSVSSIALYWQGQTMYVFLCGHLDTPRMKGIFGAQGYGRLDAYLIKMRGDGVRLWAKVIGTEDGDEFATRVKVDQSTGDVYLLGTTNGTLQVDSGSNAGSDGSTDIFFARLLTNGTLAYLRQFGSSADDSALALAVDGPNDLLYIGGSIGGEMASYIPVGDQDAFTLRVNKSTGEMLGLDAFGGAGVDFIADIAVGGGLDDIYVTGSISASIDGQAVQGASDVIICRYDRYMDRTTTIVFGTAGKDFGTALRLDWAGGHMYVGGAASGTMQGKIYAGGLDSFVSQLPLSGLQASTRPTWTFLEGSKADEWCSQLEVPVSGVGVVSLSTLYKSDQPYISVQFLNRFGSNSETQSFTKQTAEGIEGKAMAIDTQTVNSANIFYYGGVYKTRGVLGVYSTSAQISLAKLPDYTQYNYQNPQPINPNQPPITSSATSNQQATGTVVRNRDSGLPTLAQLGDLQLNAVTLICLALIMGAAWIVGALSLEAVYWYQLRLEEKEVFGPNYQYRRVVNNEDEVAIMSEREIEE